MSFQGTMQSSGSRRVFVSFGDGIDQKTNLALREVFRRIFDDKELMNFLIAESATAF